MCRYRGLGWTAHSQDHETPLSDSDIVSARRSFWRMRLRPNLMLDSHRDSLAILVSSGMALAVLSKLTSPPRPVVVAREGGSHTPYSTTMCSLRIKTGKPSHLSNMLTPLFLLLPPLSAEHISFLACAPSFYPLLSFILSCRPAIFA